MGGERGGGESGDGSRSGGMVKRRKRDLKHFQFISLGCNYGVWKRHVQLFAKF